MKAPQVGVVIPIYYGRAYLRSTLESVFQQTYDGSILVIGIEDGTSAAEASGDICREFPMQYLALSQNQGVMACRRAGAERLMDVDYLAFLDQDDTWHPNFLTEMVRHLEDDRDLVFVVANARLTEQGQGQLLYHERIPSLRLADLKVANQIVSPSQVLMRMARWKEVPWSESLSGGADDWLLWLFMLSNGHRAQYVPDILLDYRVHARGAHSDRDRMSQSERKVVDEWFLRLGFTHRDQRLCYGRMAFDGVIEGLHGREWGDVVQSLRQGIRDPWALWSAFLFRARHKSQGLV